MQGHGVCGRRAALAVTWWMDWRRRKEEQGLNRRASCLSPRAHVVQAVLAAAGKPDALGPMDENMGDEDDEEEDGEADDLADIMAKATL